MADITNTEALEMMNRCKNEIIQLRNVIDRLQPKADAYDNLAIVLHLLPAVDRLSAALNQWAEWTINPPSPTGTNR